MPSPETQPIPPSDHVRAHYQHLETLLESALATLALIQDADCPVTYTLHALEVLEAIYLAYPPVIMHAIQKAIPGRKLIGGVCWTRNGNLIIQSAESWHSVVFHKLPASSRSDALKGYQVVPQEKGTTLKPKVADKKKVSKDTIVKVVLLTCGVKFYQLLINKWPKIYASVHPNCGENLLWSRKNPWFRQRFINRKSMIKRSPKPVLATG
ncbi:hypothetical protein B0H13DRAFT_1897500 [Mycena leptocephala]|nr:hypothetical protein B0H13DRAFT_1897500 [Mycena leptocephala]